jgi:hypothetical protein
MEAYTLIYPESGIRHGNMVSEGHAISAVPTAIGEYCRGSIPEDIGLPVLI